MQRTHVPRSFISEFALGAAALVHGLALVAIARMPAKPAVEPPPAAPLAIEVETEATATERATSPEPKATAPTAALSMRGDARREAPARRDDDERASESEGATIDAPPDGRSPAPADGWSFSGRRADLDLKDRSGALARLGGVEHPRAPSGAGAGATGAVLRALDDGDRERGLARGGPLREAVLEVARTSDAPASGTAVFEVIVGPGHAPKTRLLDVSSAREGWAKILPLIDRVAAKKALRLPPNGQGLRIVIRVEAEQVMPNGLREKDLGVHTETKGLEHHDEADGISAPKITLPSVTTTIGGKVCSLALSTNPFAPISGGCDPAMIGAHLSRRVRGEIVSEERIAL